MWPKWNWIEFFPYRLDFVVQTLTHLKKDFNHLVPKRFWARHKSEHLVTQASNNVWKKYWLCGLFFCSKLLSLFLMSAIYSSQVSALQTDTGKQWWRWNFTTQVWRDPFLTLLHPSLGFDPYFGNQWARSTNQPWS